jgi:hypothetical protein
VLVAFRFAGTLAAATCATSLIAATCLAHIDLESPPPRAAGRPDSSLGQRPCGQRQNARSTALVSEFRPGESIDVLVDVYVQHPSYFRFAFDVDGDDSFSTRSSSPRDPAADDPTVLPAGEGELILGYVEDPTGDIERIEQRLTLPNVECDNCTLQVTQFIYGLPLADATYHQCADIVLSGPLAAPAVDAGSSDAGVSESGDGESGDGEGSGCTLSAVGSGGPNGVRTAVLGALVFVLAALARAALVTPGAAAALTGCSR